MFSNWKGVGVNTHASVQNSEKEVVGLGRNHAVATDQHVEQRHARDHHEPQEKRCRKGLK